MQTKELKLIINGRFLTQQKSGVQNYALGIVKALRRAGVHLEIVTPKNLINSELQLKKIGFFSGFVWEQFFLVLYARKQKGTILLNLCNSAPLLARKQIVTIHDLAFTEKANWFNPLFKMWYNYLIPRICKKAQLIITVSEFSKRRIIEQYGIIESKIIVAPPGIPEFKFIENITDYGDYALLTGANNPRKNASWVLENIEILTNKSLKLIALGENQKSFNNIVRKNSDSILYLNQVSFESYCSLLKNAKALIYPSLYEGFGIPILESLCMGTPVIASDIPVFRENFGTYPIYFEIGNKQSFSHAVDGIEMKKISEEDILNLKNKFNFDNSAKQILNALNLIM